MEKHVYVMVNGEWRHIGAESMVEIQKQFSDGVPWKKEYPEDVKNGY